MSAYWYWFIYWLFFHSVLFCVALRAQYLCPILSRLSQFCLTVSVTAAKRQQDRDKRFLALELLLYLVIFIVGHILFTVRWHKCLTDVLLSPSISLLLAGVVSVSFEEDEEGNLCLIAYPLQSDPAADLENKDPLVDCEPKSEMLKWGKTMSSSLLVDSKNYSKDGRSRYTTKDKEKGWDVGKCPKRDSSTVSDLLLMIKQKV